MQDGRGDPDRAHTVTLAALHRILDGSEPAPPVSQLVGLRMVAAEEGRVTFELDAGPQHSSPPGTLHGGIVCDLADAAMGCALVSVLEDGESFATVELKINFLKPIWSARADRDRRDRQVRTHDVALRVPHHRRGRLARRVRDVDSDDACAT